jgi:branched-chain amino acid transport system ATP-binding protein
LDQVSIAVGESQFVAIVGPNGAGKTTLFKAISGIVPIESGRIVFEGVDLATVAPAQRAHLGIAHVPEGRKVFKGLTVLENLEMGAHTKAGRAHWRQTLEQVYALFPKLAERQKQYAGTLSGGEQQMVAIARGLAARPKLLMFDEPSMGLAPAIADAIFEKIEKIYRENKISILLVEQRVAEALETCDYGYVLQSGRAVLEGKHDVLLSDPNVKRAYLGM